MPSWFGVFQFGTFLNVALCHLFLLYFSFRAFYKSLQFFFMLSYIRLIIIIIIIIIIIVICSLEVFTSA